MVGLDWIYFQNIGSRNWCESEAILSLTVTQVVQLYAPCALYKDELCHT